MNNLKSSPDLRAVMEYSHDELLFFTIYEGIGGELTEPVFKDRLWHSELDMSDFSLTRQARQIIEGVSSVVPVKQFVIGHEAPPLLVAGKVVSQPTEPKVKRQIPWGSIQKTVIIAALVAAFGFWIVNFFAVLVAAAVSTLVVLGLLLGGASLLVDPVIYCVLQDGTWIEIYSYLEEAKENE